MIDVRNLLQEANEHHNLALKSAKSSLLHARDAGERLVAIKAKVKHGEFEKLIEEHGDMMPRTAQRYMQVFRDYPAIEETMGPGRAATISLAEGLRAIKSKEKEYYPPLGGEKASDETLLIGDEDLSICPKNGLHEYEDGDDHCRHCHTPKKEIDATELRAIQEAERLKAEKELHRLFASTESLFIQLARQLDALQRQSPHDGQSDIQAALDMSYQGFRKWRHPQLATGK